MKSFKKLMLLVMVVGGVGLSAKAPEAPTDISPRGRGIMVTCPVDKTNVEVGRFNQGCCPTCPPGQVARVETVRNTSSHDTNYKCICEK